MDNKQQEKKEKFEEIDLNIDPEVFPGLHKLFFTTTTKLAMNLNNIFYSIFSDYNGMKIGTDQTGQSLYATLFFLPGTRSPHASVKTVEGTRQINVVNKNANIVERQKALSNLSRRQQNYCLTDQARKFLAKFVCNYRIAHDNRPRPLVDRVKWNEIESEVSEPQNSSFLNLPQNTQMQTYLAIRYISLEKLFGAIYGTATEDGDELQYQVQITGNIPTVAGRQSAKLLSVSCLNVNMLKPVIEELGYQTNVSNLGIIR